MKLKRPTAVLLVGAFLGTLLLAVDVGISMVREVSAAGEIPPESLINPGPIVPLPSDDTPPPAKSPPSTDPTGAPSPTAKPPSKAARNRAAGRAQRAAPGPTRPKVPTGTLLAVKGTPGLDNNPRDWAAAAVMHSDRIVSGQDTGIEADWQLLWDSTSLYLRATVRDPKIVQPFVDDPGQLFRGDSVGLELGAAAERLSDDDGLREGDAHYLFGPQPDGRAVTAVNPVRNGSFVNGSPARGARAVQHLTRSGYVMEIAIDWRLLAITAGAGRTLAANLNVSDGSADGDLRVMKSTNARRTSAGQGHPGVWQKLTLRN